MDVLLTTDPSIEDDEGVEEDEGVSPEEATTVEMTGDSYPPAEDLEENRVYAVSLWTPPSKRRDTAVESLSRILERPAGLVDAIIDRAPALMAPNASQWQMRACVAITVACGGSVLVRHKYD